MRRRADRRDVNEQPIREYLERLGCIVQPISQRGVPDLMVSSGPLGPFVVMMEIKSKSGTLTDDQETFFKMWGNSFCYVVRSRTDAKKVIRQFMPIRIYNCKECGVFERKESISSDPLTVCPTCGTIVKQIYSAPEIVFRGNGWGGKKDSEKS